MDVPESDPYAPPGRLERTSTPGTARSGLTRPASPAPRLEKGAISLAESNAPEE